MNNVHRAKPRLCRACHSAPAIRRGLSVRLCGNCLAKPALQREKPVRPPLPAYKLSRVPQEGVSKPSMDVGKGNAPAERPKPVGKSAAERRWMDRVATLPCIVCGAMPVELHHVREGQGAAQRAGHTLVLPLCPEHHRGASGLHGLGKRGFYARYKQDELDLLAETIERLA